MVNELRKNVILEKVTLTEEGTMVTIKLLNYMDDEYKFETIPRCELTERTLQRLLLKNACVCTDYEAVYESISKCVDIALIQHDMRYLNRAHSTLGWKRSNDEIRFYSEAIYSEKNNIESQYIGDFDIKRVGTLECFKTFFNDYFRNNLEMEAVLAMGAGATVLGFANNAWGYDMNNPVCHLVGNSSSGKTTAAMLFASMAGCPSLKKDDSFFISFLDTTNALVKRIGSIDGYPLAIDEFSTKSHKQSISAFIYTLANGREKNRTTAGGMVLQKSNKFTSVFITTGESSILSRCSNNDGIRGRLLEFPDIEWTTSAEEADTIKEFCISNYGILTPMISIPCT